ncbi:MAG: GntR family transcriptional regulator [Chloroflexi bacterium]|nr:GntR family transcriptional regulator [Chloroflexota bacterium]
MTLAPGLQLEIDLSARRPLRDEAYLVLRRVILTGQFKPGERLIEREIAAKMGLSRSPVREAFRRLEQERLVAVNRQGVVVQALDPLQVEELYQVRQHLEVLVARLAARNFTPKHRQPLQEILQRMSAALAAHDQVQVAAESVRFHRALAETAGNRRLASLVAAVGEEIQRFRSLNIQHSTRTAAAVREHRQIFAALAARDEERAARAMAEHIEHSWAHARQYV